MISLCCCAMNAREDVRCLVECLAFHNQGTPFEVCLTHDNRVNDGSAKVYMGLMKKYPWFKVIEHTQQDTIDWLTWMLDLYRNENRFSSEFRLHLEGNLRKLQANELVDYRKEFLWISSGILYNKAISIADGDYFLVSPADFLFLFKLVDLDNVCREMTKYNLMYGKIHALWAKVSNCPKDWLEKELILDSQRINPPFNSRMHNAQRDYLSYPSGPSDLYLADFRNMQLINFSDPAFFSKVEKYIDECFAHEKDQGIGPCFHGTHVMSRLSYKMLGGFSEGFYGRSFADDNMSRRGSQHGETYNKLHNYILPQRFSFGWVGQGEYIPDRFTFRTLEEHAQLLKIKHPVGECPIPGASGWTYLHHGYPDNAYVHQINDLMKDKLSQPPDRFTEDQW